MVELGGKTATGIVVPDDVVTALDQGRRPAVVVSIGEHSYRTTVAARGERFLVPLSAENRALAGVAAGDEIEVGIEADTAPREVVVPSDLAEAFAGDESARAAFEALAHSHRKEWVRWIEDAKKAETRARRVEKAITSLGGSADPGAVR